MVNDLPLKGVALLFSIATLLIYTTPAFASDPPSGLSFLNNASFGAKLLASIQIAQTPGLFLKTTPSSTPLPELVISPIDATKSANPPDDPQLQTEVIHAVVKQPISAPSPSPSLIASPTPSISPTVSQPSNSGGLNADILFNMVNAHREAMNLPPFQKDERACTVAQARAPQVLGELYGGVMHQGLKNMNLPYWNTENIISMRTNEEAFNWWITDEIHKEAIEGNYKYSCVACSGNSCAEEFTDFTPK